MGKSTKKQRTAGRATGKTNSGPKRAAGPAPISDEVTVRISEAIAGVVAQSGLYLESVRAMRARGTRIVQVTVDLPWGPGGLGSDRLTEVSREISARLDDADLVEGPYSLEVSTPGAERNLVETRHFSRAEGRVLDVRMADGSRFEARLESVAGDTLNLRSENGVLSVRLGDIESARVQLELGGERGEER